MRWGWLRAGIAAAASAAGLVICCPSALGAVTEAQITSIVPAGPYLFDDQMAASRVFEGNPVTISGTSDGTTGDTIAIGCMTRAIKTGTRSQRASRSTPMGRSA